MSPGARMTTWVGLLMLAAASLGARAEAAASAFPYELSHRTLRNGLQVVMVPQRGTGLVAYDTLVRVGSRNEVEPGRTGYAHFFEHMMFRGTERYSQARYQAVIQQHGATNNAYTDDDITVYTILGRAEGLPAFIEIEADRFQHLKYSRAAFETEAGTILGELNTSRSDPDAKLYETLCRAAFTRHTYQHPVIGFEADVLEMAQGYEYSIGFFRKYYTPDNTTLIIVGDFEPDAVMPLIEQAYGSWRGRAVEPKTNREPPQRGERRVELPWPTSAQPRLIMAWHIPAASRATARELAVAQLLPELLFGTTSPLYRDVVLERQVADSLGAWAYEHREPHLFHVDLSTRAADKLGEVEAAVDAVLARAAQEGVPAERLAAVKSNARFGTLAALEKPSTIAAFLAEAIGVTGDVRWMDERLAAMEAVSNDDVKAFVSRYLVRENRTVATLKVPAGTDGGSP